MNFFKHPSNNLALSTPEGHDQSNLGIYTLPVTRTTINGVQCVQSFWKPDLDELARLNAGTCLVLSVMGHTMPPVALFVEETVQVDDVVRLNITKAQLELAFEAWEQGFRIDPDKFRTAEEVADLSVSQVSAERADYLFELLAMQQDAEREEQSHG